MLHVVYERHGLRFAHLAEVIGRSAVIDIDAVASAAEPCYSPRPTTFEAGENGADMADQFMAVCTEVAEHGEKELSLTSWLDDPDAANKAGKDHETVTKGHRWRIAIRTKPELRQPSGEYEPNIKRIYETSFAPILALDAGASGLIGGGLTNAQFSRLSRIDVATVTFVDPATIELVIEGATLLLSLFGGRNDAAITGELRNIGEWVQKVEKELHRVCVLLEDIRGLLADIGVLIKTEFKQAEENKLFGYCQSYATNIAAYKADPRSGTLQKVMSDLYPALQASRWALMNYGYAPGFSVFYAFRIEIDLASILELGAATKATIAKSYHDYFDASLDSTIQGSCVNRLLSVEARKHELETAFTSGDNKGLVGPAWWVAENCRMVCYGGHGEPRDCNESCDFWRLHPAYRITGTLTAGFDGESRDSGLNFHDSNKRRNEYLPSRDQAYALATASVRADIVPSYNKAAQEYQQLEMTRKALLTMKDSCEHFRGVTKDYF